jgi:hypothetical protein
MHVPHDCLIPTKTIGFVTANYGLYATGPAFDASDRPKVYSHDADHRTTCEQANYFVEGYAIFLCPTTYRELLAVTDPTYKFDRDNATEYHWVATAAPSGNIKELN